MSMAHHEPPTPAAFRRALRRLDTGATVHTGVIDPWTSGVIEARQETVRSRGRVFITTDHGRYWFTGRATSIHNPFLYPRIIYRIPGWPS